MKIPQQLPQFSERKTLIIISGTHEARFVGAFSGEASELHSYQIEKITYSDREGHFLRRAFGAVLGSGSVYEPKKKREMIEFLSEFEKQAAKVLLAVEPEEIILLAPDYAQNQIKEKLSSRYQEKVIATVKGNYIKKDLSAILKIIGREIEYKEPPTPTSEEAQKILSKTEQK